jgi:hypothetical protein
MSLFRRAIVVVAMAGLAACRTPRAGGGAGASGLAQPVPGFRVTRQAESVPITALAVQGPYVWIGSAHGLRRWNVATDEGGWVGPESGLVGHGVSALATDADGGLWVATEAGVGRITAPAPQPRAGAAASDGAAAAASPSDGPPAAPAAPRAELRYQAKGALGGITLLAPTRGDGGAWAAGPAGLFRLDDGGWTIFDFLRDVPVTSLELDGDGATAWVGTRGRGLYRVDRNGGTPVALSPARASASPAAADEVTDVDEIVGTALGPDDVRVVAARARDGARVVFLNKGAPDAYRTQPGADVRIVGLVAAPGGPLLIAGAPGAEGIFTLRRLPRGEAPPVGGFRLLPVRKAAVDRFAAVPTGALAPPDVTVAAAGASSGATATAKAPAEIWLGTRAMGVARADAHGPQYVPGSELTDDADRVTVGCVARDRCYVVAGGAHAWLYDGAAFRPSGIGESPAGRALALATDAAGAIVGVTWEPSFAGLVLTRLKPGAPDAWTPLDRVPLELTGGIRGERPVASFAAFAPDGALWLGLGAEGADGETQGRGAVEIDLVSHKVVRHGPPAANGQDAASAESLPLPHDLTGVLFDGTATWFSSHSGMARWQESELRRWTENEHLESETCYAVAKGPDGQIWAGTSMGIGRFDGKEWRFGDADGPAAVATRAIAHDAGGRTWLATAKGLRVLPAGAAAAGGRAGPAAGERIVDDDVLDAAPDRFGRIFALGSSALDVVDAQP